MRLDGIIFDLDGTLWDSCASVAASWQETLRACVSPTACVTPAEVRGIMGMSVEQICAALFPQYGERAMELCLKCITEECSYLSLHGASVYPGVPQALASLSRSYPLFIVSNCLDGYIDCFLDYAGVRPYFKDYICQGVSGLGKAENIRRLVRRHALRAPVYVGDTLSDKQSAADAGVPFIHASYGFGGAVPAEFSLRSPAELLTLINDWSVQNV